MAEMNMGVETSTQQMVMREVGNSSHITAIGYDADSNTLRVRYKNGREYEWSGVPEEEYQQLMAAPSAGKHLRYVIEAQYGTGVPA